MKKLATLAGGIFAMSVSINTVQAATIQWVDWYQAQKPESWTNWYDKVRGQVMVDGVSVNVVLTGQFKENETQLNGGINYWGIGDAYLETPTNEDAIYSPASIFSISFSAPVKDPVVAVSDFRTYNSTPAYWVVDTPNISILSHGRGLNGPETLPLQIDDVMDNKIVGSHANGIIQFHGTFTDINIVQSKAQTYFTVGVSAVPVPAAFWLFGSGLMALVGIARRRT